MNKESAISLIFAGFMAVISTCISKEWILSGVFQLVAWSLMTLSIGFAIGSLANEKIAHGDRRRIRNVLASLTNLEIEELKDMYLKGKLYGRRPSDDHEPDSVLIGVVRYHDDVDAGSGMVAFKILPEYRRLFFDNEKYFLKQCDKIRDKKIDSKGCVSIENI